MGSLGKGGMGAVFAATHRNGKRVAIKVLHAELRANAHVRARFLREGYIANRVDHADVVSVLDDGETESGESFLVMDLLDGETLEARRKRSPLSAIASLTVADRVLDVLASAHEKGIVHRDIKPANIFLTNSGAVKVLDFGIASLREVLADSDTSTLTPTGASLGTPSFMSPEQARGRWDLVDGRTDVWAVGAVLFTLLTGRLVHEAQTPNERLIAAATSPAVPVTSVSRNIPAVVAVVIDRALALDRERRWQSAREMQNAVRNALCDLQNGSAVPCDEADTHEATWVDATQNTPSGNEVGLRGRRPRVPWLRFAAAGAALLLLGFAIMSYNGSLEVRPKLEANASIASARSSAQRAEPLLAAASAMEDSASPVGVSATPLAPPRSKIRSKIAAASPAAHGSLAQAHAATNASATPSSSESDWLDRQQ